MDSVANHYTMTIDSLTERGVLYLMKPEPTLVGKSRCYNYCRQAAILPISLRMDWLRFKVPGNNYHNPWIYAWRSPQCPLSIVIFLAILGMHVHMYYRRILRTVTLRVSLVLRINYYVEPL
jgi:hypothetical protein